MSGPMTKVKTTLRSINLDLGRKLNLGKNKILQFVVPDPTQFNNWRIVLTVDKGFNRITPKEQTDDDGRSVIYDVADPIGAVGKIIRLKDLHVRIDGTEYAVDDVPLLAPNVAQVYRLTCKTRTTRTKYFDAR